MCVKVSSLLSFNNKREKKKKKRNEIPIKSPQQTTYRATDTRTICLTLNTPTEDEIITLFGCEGLILRPVNFDALEFQHVARKNEIKILRKIFCMVKLYVSTQS